jgi:hypothetical protein
LSISLTAALHLPVALAQTAPPDLHCMPDTATLVFDAKIAIAGTELTGIAIMKRENARFRVLFTSIAGPKLLDMYVDADGHELLHAAKKLKRKKLLNFLQKTFALITGAYLASPNRECSAAECRVSLPKRDEARYLFDETRRIVAAEYLHKNKPVFKSAWSYSSDTLEYIRLQHPALIWELRIKN